MNDDYEDKMVGAFVFVFLAVFWGYFLMKTFQFLRTLPEIYAITGTYVPFMHHTNQALSGILEKNRQLEERIKALEKK